MGDDDEVASPPAVEMGQVPKLVVDGLLCCIVKALSREASQSELISVVDRESNVTEVISSWKKRFEHKGW